MYDTIYWYDMIYIIYVMIYDMRYDMIYDMIYDYNLILSMIEFIITCVYI